MTAFLIFLGQNLKKICPGIICFNELSCTFRIGSYAYVEPELWIPNCSAFKQHSNPTNIDNNANLSKYCEHH